MVIAFDAKRAFHNKSGLGNYSRVLIESVRAAFPEWRIILYSGGKEWDLIPYEWTHDPSITMVHTKGSYFRSYGVVSDLDYRSTWVYHGLSNELPIPIGKFRGKKIVTIHDVIFKFRPRDYGLIDRTIYNLKTAHAVKNADVIIAISEQTKKDLILYYGANARKIRIIYQDADPIFRTTPADTLCEQIRRQYRIDGKFWLFSGASGPRKNLPRLLEAWKKVSPEKRLPLVITGPEKSSYGKKVRRMIEDAGGNSAGLIWLGEVELETLHALYHMADALLYPSLYEGFGLPVLEALYSGTPVLISETLGFEQWYDKGVVPVDASNVDALVSSLERIDATEKTPSHRELIGVYGAEANLKKLVEIYTSEDR